MSPTLNQELTIYLFFILVCVAGLVYVLKKKFNDVGVNKKELKDKDVLQVYYQYYFDWLKKYWYIVLATTLISVFIVYTAFYTKQISFIFLVGIMILLVGIYGLIANYKKFGYLTNRPEYKFWKETGHERFARIYYYVGYIVLIIMGLIFIFYYLLK